MAEESLGQRGEQEAVNFLVQRGFKILSRNYFGQKDGIRLSEIDIVAQEKLSLLAKIMGKKEEIVFVEVKSSSFVSQDFCPEMRFDDRKKQKIAKLAQVWLSQRKISDWPWRIDVISVQGLKSSQKPLIGHYQNV